VVLGAAGWVVPLPFHCRRPDGKAIIAFADSPEHLLEICDVVVRLLVVSVVHKVIIHRWTSSDESISATSLAYLMEHCHSSLKASKLR
jgi:hypothetical protein